MPAFSILGDERIAFDRAVTELYRRRGHHMHFLPTLTDGLNGRLYGAVEEDLLADIRASGFPARRER